MAIDPSLISTVRLGQLPAGTLSLTNLIAHEIGTDLKSATVQDLADFIATYIGSTDAVGYLPLSVTDGQQLPSVPTNPSFFICGAGTYLNVNGYPDVVCTEELNVVMSLSDHWELSAQIHISAAVGVQSISGNIVDNTDPLNPVINTPNLAQVLTQGGRNLDEFISSDYTIQPSDKSKFREVITGGSDITLTLDDSTWLPSDNVVGATFIFKNSNALDVTDKVILTKSPTTGWDVCGLGGLMNEIEIPAGYIAQITYAALGFNVVLLSAKTEDKLEFQITQNGTNPPEILAGSMIGNKNSGYSIFYDDVGTSHITFDNPILANVKDCYKGTDNKTSIFTTAVSGTSIVIVSYYASDDYTINFEYFTFDFGTANPNDSILNNPVKITLEFKP